MAVARDAAAQHVQNYCIKCLNKMYLVELVQSQMSNTLSDLVLSVLHEASSVPICRLLGQVPIAGRVEPPAIR